MASLTVKNIPDELYDRLKASATLHRRSINSELIIYLERALLPSNATPEQHLDKARELRQRVRADRLLSEADITDAKNDGRQ
nr:Arc family DNA-binding protein [uncultured Halomonas sp.]